MRLGYELTIEQTQKLVMTPELIQAIQILQFNTQELESYVQEQLLTNPVLEKTEKDDNNENNDGDGEANAEVKAEESNVDKDDKEFDWAEHFKERGYDDISYKQGGGTYDPDNEYSYEQFVSSETSLTDHLMMQLDFVPMKLACKMIAKYLIEALDENGYLTSTINEVCQVFRAREDKVLEALGVIQGFEPLGVGARDLKECLIIQLQSKGEDTAEVRQIIEEHLEDIAENRLANIAKAVGITIKEAQKISDKIKSLEPKPGRQFGSSSDNRYIVPDVTVEKVGDDYVVIVNDTTAPRLNVSPFYQRMLIEADKESNITKFLSGRLNSALWLIRSIEQRRQTIYNVVKAVVDYQRDFFEQGSKHMKTLTLKQIADEVDVHESTVSRSINGKYMQTPRGLFEIKYFFTSGVAGTDGSGIASESIKSIIKEMVDKEDPKAPLSDQAIADSLEECGIDISRRTIAKYRGEMNLPSSTKRKRF
ncbi:MAG TPA: RNA polymerase factor sigma-54 [Anaerovoracaceae bacterium]|nr:RNA polymerase factor sigma-54 [Anaerovoracaceae bacterium]